MKSYKLIFELIKHPFSNVKLIMDYDLTNVRYSKYWGYLLESIYNGDVEKEIKHNGLKAGKWYICYRAYCCRADHLTVQEGERFMCEKDGIVKGFKIKEPEKYFKEVSAPAPTENEQSYIQSDEVRRSSTIQVLEYARSLDAYNQYGKEDIDKDIAWLEKQKNINLKEYVFRPLAGCDINTAAIQAIEQQKLGKKIVLAFNGAYIPVEEKTADNIVNEYYSWVEKQGEKHISSTPIWKHWKGGVAGNGEGRPIYLVKTGIIYSITSCLGFECDYVELSELDKLLSEKQGEQKPAWSEKDDKQLDIAMESCQFLNNIETIDWLKSLKGRLKGE